MGEMDVKLDEQKICLGFEPKAPLVIGDPFPKMRVETTHGHKNLPDDYAGKWFVLFSHPGDFTPVCTSEFLSFQKHLPEFQSMNTELIGLSVDQVYAHLKWTEWIQQKFGVAITFPIIADPLGEFAKKLNMLPHGKPTTVRAVFIVDEKGVIRTILYYPMDVGRNIPEIVRTVSALRVATAEDVSTPANWPQNEWIGANVFVSPADSVEKIRKRMEQMKKGEIQCYDWWMCYKPVSGRKPKVDP
ncbi:MAG: putative peroxiredoxin [Candidatus Carbobacillus altaicus]|uniref:Peroxiredoxin n=1 Tax=Candidatus Carbonibacillus altaicus TaxID=2163959 RepID=A0A2R6Y016_9BACL|nr:MAG: putative peroxiredoxin [Candidatus Carbobacillus altaicus]